MHIECYFRMPKGALAGQRGRESELEGETVLADVSGDVFVIYSAYDEVVTYNFKLYTRGLIFSLLSGGCCKNICVSSPMRYIIAKNENITCILKRKAGFYLKSPTGRFRNLNPICLALALFASRKKRRSNGEKLLAKTTV